MIQILDKQEVKIDIRKLCDLKAVCGCGIKYYTTEVNNVKKYVINSNNRIYTLNELESIYYSILVEKKVLKNITKNLPEINLEFDDFDYSDNYKIQIYKNENLEIEIKNSLVTIDIYIEQKIKESFNECSGYEHEKSNLDINIKNIVVENENFGELAILESDYKKLQKAILKNINI